MANLQQSHIWCAQSVWHTSVGELRMTAPHNECQGGMHYRALQIIQRAALH